jgi:hypothetical protein
VVTDAAQIAAAPSVRMPPPALRHLRPDARLVAHLVEHLVEHLLARRGRPDPAGRGELWRTHLSAALAHAAASLPAAALPGRDWEDDSCRTWWS